MDARCKRIRMYAFTDVNVYIWMGPKALELELSLFWVIKKIMRQLSAAHNLVVHSTIGKML